MLILDLPFCNGPLGLENGKISDSQITASSFLSPTNQPTEARFRHSGSWCPAKPEKVNKSTHIGSSHHLRLYLYCFILDPLYASDPGGNPILAILASDITLGLL